MVKRRIWVFKIATILGFVSIGLLQPSCKGRFAQEISPDSLIQEALQIATNVEDALSRSETLRQIADELMKSGRKEQAKDVLKQALDTTMDIKEEGQRSRTLCDIATLMVKFGMKDQALATFRQAMESAKGIPREVERIWNQHDVALKMAKVGLFDDAVRAAKEIRNDWVRSVTIYDIVSRAMVEVGLFERALKVAESIELLYWRLRALVSVATVMAKAGQRNKAIRALEQVLQLTWELKEEQDRDTILGEVALGMVKAGLFDRAVKIAGKIKDEERRAFTYGDIAEEMSKIGEKQMAYMLSIRALNIAMGIKQTNRHLTALSGIAFRLANAGFYDLALRAAKNAESEPIVRVWIVENMAKRGEFEKALKAARAIGDTSLRLSALSIIVSEMVRLGMKQQASQALDELLKIPKGSVRDAISAVQTLCKVAKGLAKAGMRERAKEVFEFALQLAQDIKPKLFSSIYEQAFPDVVVASLISSMADIGFIDKALKATEDLAKSKNLRPGELYPQVMHHISVKMAETGKVERALELAHSINDPLHKATSLAAIARILLCEKTKHSGTQ